MYVCACARACRAPSCIWERVDLCTHIKIDDCDTERLVFLDNNLIFLCVPSPRTLAASICLEFFFSLPLSSLSPYFPWCHTVYLTGKGGGGEREEEENKKKREKNPAGYQSSNNQWHEMMREQERNRAQTG